MKKIRFPSPFVPVRGVKGKFDAHDVSTGWCRNESVIAKLAISRLFPPISLSSLKSIPFPDPFSTAPNFLSLRSPRNPSKIQQDFPEIFTANSRVAGNLVLSNKALCAIVRKCLFNVFELNCRGRNTKKYELDESVKELKVGVKLVLIDR